MVDDSGRPGICRSKTGVEETDEPCTKRTTPFGELRLRLRHMKRRTFSPSTCLVVQCSLARTLIDCAGALGEKTRLLAAAPAASSVRRFSSITWGSSPG